MDSILIDEHLNQKTPEKLITAVFEILDIRTRQRVILYVIGLMISGKYTYNISQNYIITDKLNIKYNVSESFFCTVLDAFLNHPECDVGLASGLWSNLSRIPVPVTVMEQIINSHSFAAIWNPEIARQLHSIMKYGTDGAKSLIPAMLDRLKLPTNKEIILAALTGDLQTYKSANLDPQTSVMLVGTWVADSNPIKAWLNQNEEYNNFKKMEQFCVKGPCRSIPLRL